MSENTNSHVQHAVDAWKKIVDKQQEIAGAVTDEVVRLRKTGMDKAFENIEQAQQFSKEVAEHTREMADPTEAWGSWKDLMDRQVEVLTGAAKSVAELQTDGMDKTRTVFETFTQVTATTMDHGMKV
ncbi:MAG: hypothetical protein CVU63_15655, partial [Deltaproteobacteria bacterium HGW-Deltaproteobacteria-20]